MNVTICDMADCGEYATVHLKVIDEDGSASDWKGMEADLCGKHDGLGPLMAQWETDIEGIEKQSA